LTGTEHQIVDKETIVAEETTRITTSMDKGTLTVIKGTEPNTILKEMLPLLGTHQMPAFNAEK